MKKIQIDVFTLDELNEDAQQKAMEAVRQSEGFNYIVDQQIDWIATDWAGELERKYGMVDVEIFYDLSHSQGSGFSFSGIQPLASEFLGQVGPATTKLAAWDAEHDGTIYIAFERNDNRHAHEYTVKTIFYGVDWSNEVETNLVEDAFKEVEAWRINKCIKIKEDLYYDLNGFYEDWAIEDYIESNKTLFLADGTLYN